MLTHIVRTIYEKLAGAGGSSEQKVLCQAAIDAIDPNIRYCAYNLKLKGGQTMDIGELVAMRNQAGGLGSDILNAKLEVRGAILRETASPRSI